ncbi:MAG: DUF655 domain-containing protein [Promethearchaeota archaeon]
MSDRRYNRSGNSRPSYGRGRPSYNRRRDDRSRPSIRIPKGTELYLLDILQHGGVSQAQHSWKPIAQVITPLHFQLFEINLKKDHIPDLKLQEKYIFSMSDSDIFDRINRRLNYDQLTPTSQHSLEDTLFQYVSENEEKFVHFVNVVGPITIKRHYLEVLPGVGKKLMNEILTARNQQPFESYDDIHTRVPGFKIKEAITKRIIEELEDIDIKHYLFVKKRKPHSEQNRPHSRGSHGVSYHSRDRSKSEGRPSDNRSRDRRGKNPR